MADLGAIGKRYKLMRPLILPVWAASIATVKGRPHTPSEYSLAGTVNSSGTPVAGATLRLYNKANGALMATTRSDAVGDYAFTDLTNTAEDYFVVVFDAVENALIFDRVTPG